MNIGINRLTDYVVSSISTANEYVSLQYPASIAAAPSTVFCIISFLSVYPDHY